VTGATGFIVCQLIKLLLEKGYRVRGTVHSKDPAKVKHVLAIQEQVGGDLELFEADLLKELSFAEAFRDCDYVAHVASPFVTTVKDPQRDLVDPAVNGTLAVLRACGFYQSIKRVVLTSSMASVTDSPDGMLTEDIWNVKSSLKRNPYYFSKVEAEKAAWKFVKENKTHYDLVTILPFFVWGPSLAPNPSESLSVIISLLQGSFPMIMSLDFGFVDVRDVAIAHVLAIECPQAKGRYICFNKKLSMRELVEMVRKICPDPAYTARLPTHGADCGAGDAVVKFMANFQESGVKDFLQYQVGKKLQWTASKIEKDLGMTWTSAEDTLRDTIEDLIKRGQVKITAKK